MQRHSHSYLTLRIHSAIPSSWTDRRSCSPQKKFKHVFVDFQIRKGWTVCLDGESVNQAEVTTSRFTLRLKTTQTLATTAQLLYLCHEVIIYTCYLFLSHCSHYDWDTCGKACHLLSKDLACHIIILSLSYNQSNHCHIIVISL